MLCYNYSPDALYIPVGLNVMVFTEDYSLQNSSVLSEQFMFHLVKNLARHKERHLILDFKNIKLAESRIFIYLKDLITDNRGPILCNLSENIYKYVESDCREFLIADPDKMVAATHPGLLYLNSNVNDLPAFDAFTSRVIGSFLQENSVKVPTLLKSSNVWANQYIDIKRLMAFSDLYRLTYYKLVQLIVDKFYGSYDEIVCSSFNSAALAAAVGRTLDKDVLYLMNLGPKIAIKDRELVKNIKSGVKYLLLADMICIGNEYKLTQTILRMHDAEMVGGVAVCHYLKPSDECRIHSLVEINDGDSFHYEIHSKKIV